MKKHLTLFSLALIIFSLLSFSGCENFLNSQNEEIGTNFSSDGIVTSRAPNPEVINGVATYHQNKNIGRKFQVPDSWDKIVINENVTITGSFYMPTRMKPIEIAGKSRVTSIIQGDGSRPTNDGIKGRSYSGIRADKTPDVYIHDLRSLNPMKFHISAGFGNVVVERCDIIDRRKIHTTDGVHGGRGKTIVKDCYIDTFDDSTYVGECTLIENTTIVHNKNGAPFQVCWGYSQLNHTCIIRNCTVIDNMGPSEGDGKYNQGVVSWAGRKDSGNMNLTLKFQGYFVRETKPGKITSHMYQIGRKNTSGIKNCTIYVEGLCPYKNSVIIYGNTNSKVVFRNCGSDDDDDDDDNNDNNDDNNNDNNDNNDDDNNHPANAVRLWSDSDWKGSVALFTVGQYNQAAMVAAGMKNNDAHSIKLLPDYKATVFTGANFDGSKKIFTADASRLGGKFSNQVSSLIVEYTGSDDDDDDDNDDNDDDNNDDDNDDNDDYAANAVRLWSDPDYKGKEALFTVGDYNQAALAAAGMKNNDAHSIKVLPGYEAIIYTGGNFDGMSKVFTIDAPRLGGNFSNQVSSIRVRYIGN